VRLLENARTEIRDTLATTPHALSAPDYTDVNEIFTALPYQLGPWILRMMEAELGTPKLDALLKKWFQANRQKSVSTEQFVKFAKAETGHDFGPFFKEWNSITAVPRLEATSKVTGSVVEATLEAKNDVPKGLRVPLELSGPGGAKTVMVEPGKPVRVDAGFAVQSVRWDPDTTVLAYVNTSGGTSRRTRDWSST
jgi:aminopeptidase N